MSSHSGLAAKGPFTWRSGTHNDKIRRAKPALFGRCVLESSRSGEGGGRPWQFCMRAMAGQGNVRNAGSSLTMAGSGSQQLAGGGSQQPAGSSRSPEQVIHSIRKRYYQEDAPTNEEELEMAIQNMRQGLHNMLGKACLLVEHLPTCGMQGVLLTRGQS